MSQWARKGAVTGAAITALNLAETQAATVACFSAVIAVSLYCHMPVVPSSIWCVCFVSVLLMVLAL